MGNIIIVTFGDKLACSFPRDAMTEGGAGFGGGDQRRFRMSSPICGPRLPVLKSGEVGDDCAEHCGIVHVGACLAQDGFVFSTPVECFSDLLSVPDDDDDDVFKRPNLPSRPNLPVQPRQKKESEWTENVIDSLLEFGVFKKLPLDEMQQRRNFVTYIKMYGPPKLLQ